MSILPFCCFAPIHWYKLLAANDCVIDIHEHYPKQTFRNRFEILGANGRIALTIPVEGQKGKKVPFKDIRIADGIWKKQSMIAIRSSYGRAAYFEHIEENLVQLFVSRNEFLFDFNREAFRLLNSYTQMSPLKFSDEYISETPEAFQTPSGLVGQFAKSVLNHEFDFREKFEPSLRWPLLPSYPQVFSDRFSFESNLSILDLVLNRGNDAADFIRHT